jgi:hypothetical protein
VELSRDFYRAINFMQIVFASGGGDQPEAVYTALLEAVSMKWSKSAKRLVVLIGDAPPHKETEAQIRTLLQRFTNDRRSQVHAIITRPSNSTTIDEDTSRAFAKVAKAGDGEAVPFEDETKVLEEIMKLAFGRTEGRSLEQIYKLAGRRRNTATAASRRAVREHNVTHIRRELRQQVVSHDIIKAILADPSLAVLEDLVDIISESTFPATGRHAAAFVLQQTLTLTRPPVDPETAEPIKREEVAELKALVGQRFR